MTSTSPKDTLRRALEEIFNQGRLETADELIHPDYVNHTASPGQGRGPEGVKHVARIYRGAFSGLRLDVLHLIAEGDLVSVHVHEQGAHTGDFQGLAPTGRRVAWTWMGIYRVHEGRLIERWGRIDTQELYEQLKGQGPGARDQERY
jgi:predicted ester cyclase